MLGDSGPGFHVEIGGQTLLGALDLEYPEPRSYVFESSVRAELGGRWVPVRWGPLTAGFGLGLGLSHHAYEEDLLEDYPPYLEDPSDFPTWETRLTLPAFLRLTAFRRISIEFEPDLLDLRILDGLGTARPVPGFDLGATVWIGAPRDRSSDGIAPVTGSTVTGGPAEPGSDARNLLDRMAAESTLAGGTGDSGSFDLGRTSTGSAANGVILENPLSVTFDRSCDNCMTQFGGPLDLAKVRLWLEAVRKQLRSDGNTGLSLEQRSCLYDQLVDVDPYSPIGWNIVVECEPSDWTDQGKKGWRSGVLGERSNTINVYCDQAEGHQDVAVTIVHEMLHACGFTDEDTSTLPSAQHATMRLWARLTAPY